MRVQYTPYDIDLLNQVWRSRKARALHRLDLIAGALAIVELVKFGRIPRTTWKRTDVNASGPKVSEAGSDTLRHLELENVTRRAG